MNLELEQEFTGTDRYQVQNKIGEGGNGAVYAVLDRETGLTCALKVLTVRNTKALLRFKREFRTLTSLHHRNLVRLYDLQAQDELWFFTMELVQGLDICEALQSGWGYWDMPGSLASMPSITAVSLPAARAGEPAGAMTTPGGTPRPGDSLTPAIRLTPGARLTPGTPRSPGSLAALGAVGGGWSSGSGELRTFSTRKLRILGRLLTQLLEALDYLHAQGIVHRDLKPGNLLVRQDGSLCLLDFGIAKDYKEIQTTGSEQLGIGTAAYMAPEQALGEQITPAADFYALGCVLFELLTGRLPFEGEGYQLLLAHQSQSPPSVESLVRGVPEPWRQVCQGLLAKRPTDRPGSVAIRQRLGLEAGQAGELRAQVEVESLFVGRQEQLAALRDELERCRTEQRLRLTLVEGSSGSGKTALVGEFIRQVHQLGGIVLRGRCYEREALPYRAFDQIVDGLVLRLTELPEAERRLLRPAVELACPIFPGFRLLLEQQARKKKQETPPPRSTPEVLAGQDPRWEAFRSLFALLGRLASAGPVLLAIDDLQWMDAESGQLLDALLSRDLARPILVLGLYRPEDVGPDHPLPRVIDRYTQNDWLVRLRMEPLRPAEVEEFLDLVLDQPLGPAQAELIRDAEGNPLVLAQLVKLLGRADAPSAPPGETRSVTLRSLVANRLAELSPTAREILELAATSGGAFDRDTLCRASGLPAATFNQGLEELLYEKLFRLTPERSRTPASARGSGSEESASYNYDFYHDKYRETAYAALTPARRLELHRLLARQLEAGPADAEQAEALLRHWTAIGDAQQQSRFRQAAAERAAEKLAFRRAIALYQEELAARAEATSLSRVALWERLAELHETIGELEQAMVAQRQGLQFLAQTPAGRARDQRELRLTAKLANNLVSVRRLAEGYRAYERVLASRGWKMVRPYGEALAVILWLRFLVVVRSLLSRDRADGLTQAELDELAFRQTVMYSALPLSYLAAGEYALRLQLHALQVGELRYQLYVRALTIYSDTFQAPPSPPRLARQRRELQQFRSRIKSGDEPVELAWLELAEGLLCFQDDRAGAVRALERAADLCRAHGLADRREGQFIKGWLAYAYELVGDFPQALTLCEELGTSLLSGVAVFVHCTRSRIALRQGELERAGQILEAWEQTLHDQPFGFERFWFEVQHAQLAVRQGRGAEVLRRGDQLHRPMRDIGCLLTAFPRAHWTAAWLEAALLRQRQAALEPRLQRRARQQARQLARRGWPNHRCLGYRALALLEQAAGQPAAGHRWLTAALHTSASLAEPHHRWLCLQTARELGRITADQAREADDLAQRFGFR